MHIGDRKLGKIIFSKISSRRSSKLTPKNPFFLQRGPFTGPQINFSYLGFPSSVLGHPYRTWIWSLWTYLFNFVDLLLDIFEKLFFYQFSITNVHLIPGFRGRRPSLKNWRILVWTPEYQVCYRFRHMYMLAIITVSKVVARCCN